MPILKRRNKWMKVYRPNGTRYAEARDSQIDRAIFSAFENFKDEFGEGPRQEETLIEVMGVTADWVAMVFEVKE